MEKLVMPGSTFEWRGVRWNVVGPLKQTDLIFIAYSDDTKADGYSQGNRYSRSTYYKELRTDMRLPYKVIDGKHWIRLHVMNMNDVQLPSLEGLGLPDTEGELQGMLDELGRLKKTLCS